MNGGIVFILGAGASVSAGAPVMKNFFQKSKHLKRKRLLGSCDDDYDRVEYARGILRRAKIKSRLDVDNLEEIYTALEMVEILEGIEGLDSVQAKQTQRSLDRLIAATLEQSVQFPVVRDTTSPKVEPTEDYWMLCSEIKAIKEREPRVPITLLTFNYDLAFDYSLHYEKMKFTYCLEEKSHNAQRQYVQYCKLHGSLHWALDEQTHEIVEGNLDYSELKKLGLALLEAKHVCIRVESLWNTKSKSKLHFPFIIPPTGHKPYLHGLLKPVWKEAGRAIRNAELIVIIGYSFPATDPFFRNFFALSSIGPSDLERILIVDPNDEANTRLVSIISPDLHDKIEYLPKAFGESMIEIATALDDYIKQW